MGVQEIFIRQLATDVLVAYDHAESVARAAAKYEFAPEDVTDHLDRAVAHLFRTRVLLEEADA